VVVLGDYKGWETYPRVWRCALNDDEEPQIEGWRGLSPTHPPTILIDSNAGPLSSTLLFKSDHTYQHIEGVSMTKLRKCVCYLRQSHCPWHFQ